MSKKRFLSINERGNLTIPPDIRRQFRLGDPGAQVELVLREGFIELHPQVAVPADQAWFWTSEWQKGEHRVDEHVAAGRVAVADDIGGFLAAMDKVRRKKKRAVA